MIDYKKIKLAHKLYPQGYLKIIPIFSCNGKLEQINYSMDIDGVMASYYYDIDRLIAAVQSVAKPKPRYKRGDTVWWLDTNEPQSTEIFETVYCDGSYSYTLHGGLKLSWHEENSLYPTREALIESQIAYWQSLLPQQSNIAERCEAGYSKSCQVLGEIVGTIRQHQDKASALIDDGVKRFLAEKECQHESDGIRYAAMRLRSTDERVFEYKCTKCGEFYE